MFNLYWYFLCLGLVLHLRSESSCIALAIHVRYSLVKLLPFPFSKYCQCNWQLINDVGDDYWCTAWDMLSGWADSKKVGQMKVVNCQAAVRHSDTFNFGTRSPVDAFKYWNPSQPQPSFQFPSKESVWCCPSLHIWCQSKERFEVIKGPAKHKSPTTSSLFTKKQRTKHRNSSHTYIERYNMCNIHGSKSKV